MRNIIIGLSAVALVAGAAGAVSAEPGSYGYGPQQTDYQHDNGQHAGWGHDRGADYRWRHGDRMGYNDWTGAQHVDYREHHLRRPPHGYEWRESNGRFILAAVATGVVASIVLDHSR